MANEFIKKYGDTEPLLVAQLLDHTGFPASLGAATVELHIGQSGPPLVLLAEIVIGDLDGTPVTEFDGWVMADLPPTLLAAGIYPAEWQVTWSDGAVQSFPNDGAFSIIIFAEIA